MQKEIVDLSGISDSDLCKLEAAGVSNGTDLSLLDHNDIVSILTSQSIVVTKKLYLIGSYIAHGQTVTDETTIHDIQKYCFHLFPSKKEVGGNTAGVEPVAESFLQLPTQCPLEGVVGTSKLIPSKPKLWLFLGNHFANFDYLYKTGIVTGNSSKAQDFINESHKIHTGRPVRLRKSAGFMRCWGLQHERIGDQTCITIVKLDNTDNSSSNDSTTPFFAEAHDMVGVLVPIFHMDGVPTWLVDPDNLRATEFRHVDWLAWPKPPLDSSDMIHVHGFFDVMRCKPPTCRKPLLQTYLDIVTEAALLAYHNNEDFAVEWLMSTHWWFGEEGQGQEASQTAMYYLNDREDARRPWAKFPMATQVDRILSRVCSARDCSSNNIGDDTTASSSVRAQRLHESEYGVKHYKKLLSEISLNETSDDHNNINGLEFVPPHSITIPRVKPNKSSNFLFGFGSIIQTKSRASSDPQAADAAPCRISAEWGYIREWNFQASTAQICALGLRRRRHEEKIGSTINGVIFPAPDDLTEFDKRENGYARVEIPMNYVQILSWHQFPTRKDGEQPVKIFAYVPYAPSVVKKFGNDPNTDLPLCSGANIPPNLDVDTEGPGVGLNPPSYDYPILQTYIDVCLSGCLEHGDSFAKEFLETTFLWSPYWLNERTLSRRPWLHEKQYVKIDSLLKEVLGEDYFACRKLESEYAVLSPGVMLKQD